MLDVNLLTATIEVKGKKAKVVKTSLRPPVPPVPPEGQTRRSAPTGVRIVEEARKWIGTPFHHAQRSRGLACDCVGLLIGVGNDLGLMAGYEPVDYSRIAPPGLVRSEIEKFCTLLAEGIPPESGDVLLFKIGGFEQHVAIYVGPHSEGTMIHAYESLGRVVEMDFDESWVRRCVGVYRWRGLE